MTPAGGTHGSLAMRAGAHLFRHVGDHGLGEVFAAETGFKIRSNPDTVRAPDAAFLRQERIEQLGPVEGYIPGAPDLAIEVVSPGDTYTEVTEKVFEWLEAGARMVVVIQPRKRRVTVYRSREDIRVLAEGDTIEGGDVVPGWRLPLAELFA